MGRDGFDFIRSVCRLERVALSVEGWVRILNCNIMLWNLGYVVPDDLSQRLALLLCLLSVPCPGSLHLMKDRVMTSINGISSIDVCTDEISFAFVVAKGVGLMC